jgi:hypothetical protein
MHFFRLVCPPYLPIICPRLICMFSDIYLVGHAIPSLGSLEVANILLLGEPGISSGRWQLRCFCCNSAIFLVCAFYCPI